MDTYLELIRNQSKYSSSWGRILNAEADRNAQSEAKIPRGGDGRYLGR